MPKNLIDTNLIIRFLVGDDPTKASKVAALLGAAGVKNILLDVVVAEIIWVLDSYYELSKESIIEKIRALIHVKSISTNRKLLDRSLLIWETNNISFIDAYIAASAELENMVLYSYDFRFDKVSSVVRKEP